MYQTRKELIERFEAETGQPFDRNGPMPRECEHCGELVQYRSDHKCDGEPDHVSYAGYDRLIGLGVI